MKSQKKLADNGKICYFCSIIHNKLADNMDFISVKEWAERHGIAVRTARNYCAVGKIPGAYLVGKTWNVPVEAPVPRKTKRISPLLLALREEKSKRLKGGIYHRVQIDLTYNSNHIEGSRLTHDQTRYIYETNTIGVTSEPINVDDIIETTNHFRAIDYVIDFTDGKITESYVKHLHAILKAGTSDAQKDWFRVGNYKKLPNEVGGKDTVAPKLVGAAMKALLKEYNEKKMPTFEDILDFHERFESIHPFQDGNGRVGRLIMFRECLRCGYVPFIISDDLKMFYYNGLRHWPDVKGFLMDTCLSAQDNFKAILAKFGLTQ